jgi:NAD-dependent SIR2 family protein deacetylase
MADVYTRKRYWARSLVGWRRMHARAPQRRAPRARGLGHAGRIEQLVTQNVDGLHQAAGSQEVIDLHGRIDVGALPDCGERIRATSCRPTCSTATSAFPTSTR